MRNGVKVGGGDGGGGCLLRGLGGGGGGGRVRCRGGCKRDGHKGEEHDGTKDGHGEDAGGVGRRRPMDRGGGEQEAEVEGRRERGN